MSRYKQSDDPEVKNEERRKASEFLEKNRSLLADNLTTMQFLALNYYLPIQDYEKFLEMVEEILVDPQVSRVTSRKVFYLWQKGIALNKLGRKEEALQLVEEGLSIAPYNRQLQSLRDCINNPETDDEKPAATQADETPSAESEPEALETEAVPAEEAEEAESEAEETSEQAAE